MPPKFISKRPHKKIKIPAAFQRFRPLLDRNDVRVNAEPYTHHTIVPLLKILEISENAQLEPSERFFVNNFTRPSGGLFRNKKMRPVPYPHGSPERDELYHPEALARKAMLDEYVPEPQPRKKHNRRDDFNMGEIPTTSVFKKQKQNKSYVMQLQRLRRK